jgi:hypothetical protein
VNNPDLLQRNLELIGNDLCERRFVSPPMIMSAGDQGDDS